MARWLSEENKTDCLAVMHVACLYTFLQVRCMMRLSCDVLLFCTFGRCLLKPLVMSCCFLFRKFEMNFASMLWSDECQSAWLKIHFYFHIQSEWFYLSIFIEYVCVRCLDSQLRSKRLSRYLNVCIDYSISGLCTENAGIE